MQNKESDILVIRTAESESGRIFFIKFLFFDNGCFIAIAEASDRIGSISVSISSSNKVNTARVIPSKFDSIFISSISERISLMINGICILSLHNTKQLNLDDMKAIMEEIMNLLGEKYSECDYKKGERADYRQK
jgi:hypothetical protein